MPENEFWYSNIPFLEEDIESVESQIEYFHDLKYENEDSITKKY